jgi:hypothetical protein
MKLYSKDGWISVVDCHLCKKQTTLKESYINEYYHPVFGVAGYSIVRICKECNREKQIIND